jgi:hypothetical protein
MPRSRTEQRQHLPDNLRIERLEEDEDRDDERWSAVDAKLDALKDSIDEKFRELGEQSDKARVVAYSVLSSMLVGAVLLALNLAAGIGK